MVYCDARRWKLIRSVSGELFIKDTLNDGVYHPTTNKHITACYNQRDDPEGSDVIALRYTYIHHGEDAHKNSPWMQDFIQLCPLYWKVQESEFYRESLRYTDKQISRVDFTDFPPQDAPLLEYFMLPEENLIHEVRRAPFYLLILPLY